MFIISIFMYYICIDDKLHIFLNIYLILFSCFYLLFMFILVKNNF